MEAGDDYDMDDFEEESSEEEEEEEVTIVMKLFAFLRHWRIRHICRKTTVLSCHRCLINTGIEKTNQ